MALSLAMSSRRFAAVAALTLALSGGCGQSLFDSNPGDDGADDGGDDPDAGQDGGDDGDAPDAGTTEPDAAPQVTCPAPCAGDAVAEFSAAQGDPWSYLVDDGAPSGLGYQELVFGDFEGLSAWREGEVAIASCDDSDAAACAGLSGYLLVYPGVAGGPRAVLSFRPPETAGYRLSGAVRVGSGQPLDVPISFILSRVGRHDAISVRTVRTSEDDVALDAVFPAVEGEEILLTVGAPGEEAPPVAMRVFFTRIDEGADAFPGSCELSVSFDGTDPLADDCRGVAIRNLTDDDKFPGLSAPGASASERLGQAHVFSEHQYMTLGAAPLDYSGDFTIQFWARVDALPKNAISAAYYADWNNAVRGGVAIFSDQEDDALAVCRMENGSPPTGEDDCLLTTEPDDGQWHFFRMVRSREDASLALCIDGQETLRRPVPAGADLTSDEPPRIGRNVVYSPAYFAGAMDQVRVSTEALPCETN